MPERVTPVDLWWEEFGPVVVVTFPAANSPRAVAHELGRVPDGYLVVEADGPVYRAPGRAFTRDLAYMQSSAAGTRASLRFYSNKEASREG